MFLAKKIFTFFGKVLLLQIAFISIATIISMIIGGYEIVMPSVILLNSVIFIASIFMFAIYAIAMPEKFIKMEKI